MLILIFRNNETWKKTIDLSNGSKIPIMVKNVLVKNGPK